MRCISPLRLVSGTIVPCGKCNYCLETRRIDWTFRLIQEMKVSIGCVFLTMTYSDDVIPEFEFLRKRDVQLFIKSLRKRYGKLRYFAVGEYGTMTARPHYHALLFNCFPEFVYHDIWCKGNVYVGTVTNASIHYVTKYHINPVGDCRGREPPFCLMSRRPGIGSNYLGSHRHWHRADKRNYVKLNGIMGRLPRFYRDKFFSVHEKLLLARNGVELGDLAYIEAIVKLSSFHCDPYFYYDERMVHQHDALCIKSNLLNKF